MKISKNSAKVEPVDADVAVTNYEKVCDCIKSAVDELGKTAKSDSFSREVLANLSVILFDIKGR